MQSLLIEPIPGHESYYVQVTSPSSFVSHIFLFKIDFQLREGLIDALMALGKLNTYEF